MRETHGAATDHAPQPGRRRPGPSRRQVLGGSLAAGGIGLLSACSADTAPDVDTSSGPRRGAPCASG